MLQYRSHRLRAIKLNQQDKDANLPCPFCDTSQIVDIVHEGKTMRVIRNRVPYDLFEDLKVQDHVMLVPKAHRTGYKEFTDEEKIEYIDLAAKYEDDFYNLYTRARGTSTRSVTHLHSHLVQTKGQRLKFVIYSSKPFFLLHGTRVKELTRLGK